MKRRANIYVRPHFVHPNTHTQATDCCIWTTKVVGNERAVVRVIKVERGWSPHAAVDVLTELQSDDADDVHELFDRRRPVLPRHHTRVSSVRLVNGDNRHRQTVALYRPHPATHMATLYYVA